MTYWTNCTKPECQTTGGCAHRGPLNEPCWERWIAPPQTLNPVQGCICPPTSEQTCKNPFCPRGGAMPYTVT
jgi:hypothetical protein